MTIVGSGAEIEVSSRRLLFYGVIIGRLHHHVFVGGRGYDYTLMIVLKE